MMGGGLSARVTQLQGSRFVLFCILAKEKEVGVAKYECKGDTVSLTQNLFTRIKRTYIYIYI